MKKSTKKVTIMLKISEIIRFSSSLCADNGHNVEFLSAKMVTEGYQPNSGRYRE
jgi:hypothetical protein